MLFTDRDTRAINTPPPRINSRYLPRDICEPIIIADKFKSARSFFNNRSIRLMGSEFTRKLGSVLSRLSFFLLNLILIFTASKESEKERKKTVSRIFRRRVHASSSYIPAVLRKNRGGGRKRNKGGEDESGWSLALIRLSEPPRRDSTSHTDMAGYANKTDAR